MRLIIFETELYLFVWGTLTLTKTTDKREKKTEGYVMPHRLHRSAASRLIVSSGGMTGETNLVSCSFPILARRFAKKFSTHKVCGVPNGTSSAQRQLIMLLHPLPKSGMGSCEVSLPAPLSIATCCAGIGFQFYSPQVRSR